MRLGGYYLRDLLPYFLYHYQQWPVTATNKQINKQKRGKVMRWYKIKQNTNIGKKKSKICQIGMKVSDCLTVELWEYGAKRSDNEAVMSG